MDDPHREYCRRQHRVIGNFLAIQAWLMGVDCIALERKNLEKFLGLKRFKSTRVKWLLADLKPWFPHQEPYYLTNTPSSINSLFVSRVPIKRHLPSGSMTTPQRIARMDADAPKTQVFSKASLSSTYDQREIIPKLVLYAAGLESPKLKVPIMRRTK